MASDGLESDLETRHVGRRPKSILASAIGADDGRCAYFYHGIDARCSGDAAAHTFIEHDGEWQKVEMCDEHVRDDETGETGEQADDEESNDDRPQRDFDDYFSQA